LFCAIICGGFSLLGGFVVELSGVVDGEEGVVELSGVVVPVVELLLLLCELTEP